MEFRMKELRDRIKKMIESNKIGENSRQSYPQRKICFIFIMIVILSLGSISAYAQDEQTKNVLVLNSYHKGFPWTDNLINGFMSVLKPENSNIEIITEYMDTKTQGYDKEYKQKLYELYNYKYKNQNFDLIISSDDNAFNFLISYLPFNGFTENTMKNYSRECQ